MNQAMIPSDRTAFQIGDWRVEPALDEIARDGVTAKLEPRRMRVLVCLAEHAGEVVSIQQLLDAVWKDLVVTHDSVYQAVAGLRRALGDDQKSPIYIANVQRRGYRLIAPVAPWNAVQSAATSDSTQAAAGSSQDINRPIPTELRSVSEGPDRPAKSGTEAVSAPQPLPVGRSRRDVVLRGITVTAVIVAGIALSAFWRVRHMQMTNENARNVLLPAIEEALAKAPYSDARLLGMALEAERALPHDHTLAELWPLIATTLDDRHAAAGRTRTTMATALSTYRSWPYSRRRTR